MEGLTQSIRDDYCVSVTDPEGGWSEGRRWEIEKILMESLHHVRLPYGMEVTEVSTLGRSYVARRRKEEDSGQ